MAVQSVNRTTEAIIGAAIEVHKHLGPGLLESAYEECLCHELNLRNIQFHRQVPLSVVYKGVKLDCGYRIDILVENKVVIELKVVEAFNDVHISQTLTYMKLAECRLGLLLNFYTKSFKNGIKRLIL